jgi:hypothetical protein
MHENENQLAGTGLEKLTREPVELNVYDLFILGQVPSLIRKPAVPLPFEAEALKLKLMTSDRLNGMDGHCDDNTLHEAGERIFAQVREYFARQARYPFKRGQSYPQVTGLADYDEDGLMAPAVYHVDWSTFAARFGYTPRRRKQLAALLAALHLVKKAGGKRASIGGSFITAKVNPGDIDCRWEREGLDWTILEPMLIDLSHSTKESLRWCHMRRGYFGLDCGFSEDGLEYRSLVECAINLPSCLAGCPVERCVGVVSLDLTGDLPASEGFMPFSMWSDGCLPVALAVADLVHLRRRLPEHWSEITDEALLASGVTLVNEDF